MTNEKNDSTILIRSISAGSHDQLVEELRWLQADERVIDRVTAAATPVRLLLDSLPVATADLLCRAMETAGGEAVQAPAQADNTTTIGRCLLAGTRQNMEQLLATLDDQPDNSVEPVSQALQLTLSRLQGHPSPTTIGPLMCYWGSRTYVMGILNVTPDSFSEDGLLTEENWLEAVVSQACRMAEQGADILDVGGESTRPGSQPVSEEEELRRVIPAIKAIAAELDIAISVDTYKAKVARQALEAGAHLVNDVWGFRMDPDIARVVADYDAPAIVMHNRSRPKDAVQEEKLGGRYVGVEYNHLLADVLRELKESIELGLAAGVAEAKIIIDNGIGFGKTVEQNLTLLNQLDEFRVLGRPILIGPSRKSFIGYTLDLPPQERVEGTGATVALGIERGADIVRVHNVREMVRVARMADALVRG
jgi:dihydropteroate synthase